MSASPNSARPRRRASAPGRSAAARRREGASGWTAALVIRRSAPCRAPAVLPVGRPRAAGAQLVGEHADVVLELLRAARDGVEDEAGRQGEQPAHEEAGGGGDDERARHHAPEAQEARGARRAREQQEEEPDAAEERQRLVVAEERERRVEDEEAVAQKLYLRVAPLGAVREVHGDFRQSVAALDGL